MTGNAPMTPITEGSGEDIVRRLREAYPNSAQLVVGSHILKEAADYIESLHPQTSAEVNYAEKWQIIYDWFGANCAEDNPLTGEVIDSGAREAHDALCDIHPGVAGLLHSPERQAIPDGEDDDNQGCESCDKSFPIEQMTSGEDGWFCPECIADWRKDFESCEHDWKIRGDEKFCEKCSTKMRCEPVSQPNAGERG